MRQYFKSIGKVFKDRLQHFGDESSLHGMRYVFSTKPINIIKRIFWMFFVTFSAYGMIYILIQSSEIFQRHSISFTPETTYLKWNVDFPAVSICEHIDYDKLIDFYEDNDIPVKLMTFYKEVIFLDSQHYCRSCSTCKKDKCPEDFASLPIKYRSTCNETILKCSWRDEEFECCDRFKPIQTEYGECFVFNSAHFQGERLHLSNQKTGPGYLKFTAMETVRIDVHSPDDILFNHFDKQMISGTDGEISFASEFILKLKIEETTNEPDVVRVKAEDRGCLFWHEFPVQPTMYPRHSYSTCIVQCRAVWQLKTCNCTHHMLPRIENEKVCDIEGLVCLNKYFESIDVDIFDEICNCLPSCEEPKYEKSYLINKPNHGALTDELIERGSLISIFMEYVPTTRLHRVVVRSPLDQVVYIGGTAGIFFGASILSLIEIFYLFFIRKY